MELRDISESDLSNLTAQGYTNSDLAMLAPTEVQALLAYKDDSNSDNTVDLHEAAEREQIAAAAAAAAKAPADSEGASQGEGSNVVTETASDAPFVPQYTAEVPVDAEEKIKALKGEEAAAFKRLMDGEIDADEYQSVKTRVETETDTLKTQALTASIFEQANAQTTQQLAEAEWKRSENAAFNAFKAEGLDYKAKPALLAAYNTHLKTLGTDPKNENRDAPWFLTEAHRLTKEDLGIKTVPGVKIDIPTPRQGVDISEIPPTLRSVPVAATGAVNVDEFAHLRNLDGIALERAHAKLTPEQRDRWMAE